MCCIAGKRCSARARFSRKLSTQSWNNFVSETTAPFCWVIPGTVGSHSAPRSPGPPAALGWGGGGSRAWAAPAWARGFPPRNSPFVSGGEASSSACDGSPSPSEPPRQRRLFPSPPAEGRGLPGRHPGAAGQTPEAARRCWPRSLPPLSGSRLEPPSSLRCLCGEGGVHSGGR